MDKQEIQIGKWYAIKSYGFEDGIRGKCVDIVGDCVYLKFFWGHPFRTTQVVELHKILGEARRPSLFSN